MMESTSLLPLTSKLLTNATVGIVTDVPDLQVKRPGHTAWILHKLTVTLPPPIDGHFHGGVIFSRANMTL